MDYRILGPLEVRDGDRELSLGSPRLRALLGLLLLHRNEPVSSERLIDELWDGAPPATANKALQNGVSQLRRVLPEDVLRTVPRGYELRVGEDELDADRFERALDAARDDTDPESAAATLRAALELWRGPALPELADVIAAQPELARLEDRRAAAFEDRVEADLERGRHAELVGELEAEVARHPLRERLRAQLMLALYRSGRQADALGAYQDARRTLVDELGLEPGPELRARHEAILRQDPALDPPPGRRRRPPTRGPRAAPVLLLAGGALLALVVVAAVVLVGDGDEPATASARVVPGNSLVALDARTGDVQAVVPTGSTPTSVATGGGGVWALNADDKTLTRAESATGAARTFTVPGTPFGVTAGDGAVWVATGSDSRYRSETVVRRVLELAPTTGAVRRDVALPRDESGQEPVVNAIAATRDAVWVIGPGNRLFRIAVEGAAAPARVPVGLVYGVAADGDGVWVITEDPDSPVLARVSERGRVTRRVPIPAAGLDGLAVGAGAVWATAPEDGLLWHVTRTGARSIDVGVGAQGVTVAGDGVWVANAAQGTATRLDPRRRRVTTIVRIGNAPRAVSADGARVWVTVAAGGGAPARDAGRSVAGAVRSTACSAVVAGAGAPERLIVSDLPLQLRDIGELPDVIGFVLRRHGFRAGRFSLGYQSCDDSTAQAGGYDEPKCRANAALYARTPRVIGIVGPYNSGCAYEQLPITNRAPGGPIAMISPTSTLLPLTKPLPGGDPGLLGRLYPTGVRHFARLFGSDDAQAAALVRFAHAQGYRRLAIVAGDDEFYGLGIAWHARRQARALGMRIVGPRLFDIGRSAADARAVAGRVTAARPDAVLFAAVAWGSAYPFAAAVRARGLPMLAPDAWLASDETWEKLGDRARGIYASAPGVPLDRVSAAGRRFIEEFRATQPGGQVSQEAIYTAQATEVMLDAIARSDGTRASVTRALLTTKIADGLIGPVRFDKDGDVEPSPFSIVRLERTTTLNGVTADGQNVVTVISP